MSSKDGNTARLSWSAEQDDRCRTARSDVLLRYGPFEGRTFYHVTTREVEWCQLQLNPINRTPEHQEFVDYLEFLVDEKARNQHDAMIGNFLGDFHGEYIKQPPPFNECLWCGCDTNSHTCSDACNKMAYLEDSRQIKDYEQNDDELIAYLVELNEAPSIEDVKPAAV